MGYSLVSTTAVENGRPPSTGHANLVIISSPYSKEGWYPVLHETIENITPELLTGSGLPEAYVLVAPYPNNWTSLIDKVKELDRNMSAKPPKNLRPSRRRP